MMATTPINPSAQQPKSTPAPAKSLLGGLLKKGEIMIGLGCSMLLIVLFSCVGGAVWLVSSWSTPADPAPIEYRVKPGEHENSSLDRCPVGQTARPTARGMVSR